jgi:hypothetical protein
MGEALVFYSDGTGPVWSELISAVSLGDGLLCFLTPHGTRPGQDDCIRPGDELLLRWPSREHRVRVELVRQAEGWACYVLRGQPVEV